MTTHASVRRLPGDSSMWMFVLGDMVLFAAYFLAYMLDRGRNHALFLEAQQLVSRDLGFVNTLILLTSSLFAALSVQAARAGERDAAARFLASGGACGAAFVLVKSFEWFVKMRAGLTLGTGGFFMHYYMMTGAHLAHVLLGLGFLVLAWRELRGVARPSGISLEAGATYWHMVDVLWIIIFALLYLVR